MIAVYDACVFYPGSLREASVIVTCNLNDFPQTDLASYNIEAISPDEFVCRFIQNDSGIVMQTACRHRTRLTRPPKTVEEYLATLEKQGLVKTVAFLRKHQADI